MCFGLGRFVGLFPQAQGLRGLVVEQSEHPRISYGNIALPLGSHLALSVKGKIWKGEFVDMFNLLQVEPEPVLKLGDPIKDSETTKKGKIDKNWMNWLNGFVIYASVLLQMYPNKAIALFKSLDFFYRAFRDYNEPAWSSYDEYF